MKEINTTKTLLGTFLIMLISIPSMAQDKVSGGSGGFHIGFKQYSTSNYSYFLEDGVTDLDDNILTIGGGGYHIIKNWMIGGYGFYRGGESRDVPFFSPGGGGQEFNYALNGGGGYLTLGYVAFHTDKLLVFPQLGIGLESLTLNKTLNEDITFQPDDFLSTDYSWSSPMLDIGAGVDFFPLKGLKVGLRAGYNFSLQKDNDWKHRGGDLLGTNLPENDLDGFYIHLTLGGGWIKSE